MLLDVLLRDGFKLDGLAALYGSLLRALLLPGVDPLSHLDQHVPAHFPGLGERQEPGIPQRVPDRPVLPADAAAHHKGPRVIARNAERQPWQQDVVAFKPSARWRGQ